MILFGILPTFSTLFRLEVGIFSQSWGKLKKKKDEKALFSLEEP